MQIQLRRTLILSVSTLALLGAPVMLQQSGLPLVPDSAAIAGNGNGNGNGGDNGGGNGGGNSGDHGGGNSGSDHGGGNGGGGNSASATRSGDSQAGERGNGARSKKSSDGTLTAVTRSEETSSKERNLKAELAGLNSLKRNINGLMNSSDPRMDGIREFIVASAALEEARAESELATRALRNAAGAYLDLIDGLGLDRDLSVTPQSLQAQIDDIVIPEDDPDTEEVEGAELIEQKALLEEALKEIEDSGLWTALIDANDAAKAEAKDLADAEAAADEDVLKAALLEAANANRRSEAYLTDDIMNWANRTLGVGDADGLIDDYIASQN